MTGLERGLVGIAALFFAIVGGMLVVSPRFFYDTIPGVAAAGAYDAHLLRDVGIAYVTLALASGLGLRDRKTARFAMLLATVYLCGHALLHAILEFSNVKSVVALELPGIYLPAIYAVGVSMLLDTERPGESDEQRD